MPVPKKKTSTSRRDKRRSHHALRSHGEQKCSQCNELKKPHHVCTSCGYYKDKEIIEIPLAI